MSSVLVVESGLFGYDVGRQPGGAMAKRFPTRRYREPAAASDGRVTPPAATGGRSDAPGGPRRFVAEDGHGVDTPPRPDDAAPGSDRAEDRDARRRPLAAAGIAVAA